MQSSYLRHKKEAKEGGNLINTHFNSTLHHLCANPLSEGQTHTTNDNPRRSDGEKKEEEERSKMFLELTVAMTIMMALYCPCPSCQHSLTKAFKCQQVLSVFIRVFIPPVMSCGSSLFFLSFLVF